MKKIITERENGRLRIQMIVEGPTLTEQSHRERCDINCIMRKALKTGLMPATAKVPKYGDFSGVMDYQSAVEAINRANTAFGCLPSHIRKRFDNDPAEMLKFLEDIGNISEAVELGLVEPVEIEQGQASEAPLEPQKQ